MRALDFDECEKECQWFDERTFASRLGDDLLTTFISRVAIAAPGPIAAMPNVQRLCKSPGRDRDREQECLKYFLSRTCRPARRAGSFELTHSEPSAPIQVRDKKNQFVNGARRRTTPSRVLHHRRRRRGCAAARDAVGFVARFGVKNLNAIHTHCALTGTGNCTHSHRSADCHRPITDIRIIAEDAELPDGYEVLQSTMFGADARLNRGTWFGARTYLCVSRDAPGAPITDVILIFGDEGELCPAGYMKINHNLNAGQRGHDVYLCFTKDVKNPPLVDLQLIAPAVGESFPPAYTRVTRSMHEGAYGTRLHICYRKSPTSKLDLAYRTAVLDHYPKVDRPDSPLPQPVALFCQPQGARIRTDVPLPTFNTFVLTTSSGAQTYGACVTFYERLVHDRQFRSLKRAAAAAAAVAYRQGVAGAVAADGADDGIAPPLPPTAAQQQPAFNSLHHAHAPLSPAVVYAPKSICLLSFWPFYNCFKEFLTELYRIAMSASSPSSAHPLPIESYLANLWECPLPVLPSIGVRLNIGLASIVFAQPPRDDFPLTDFSFDLVFRLLSFDTLVAVVEAVLAERKIILCSHHLSVLTPACETLRALIFPLQWEHAYIPVLPVAIQSIVSDGMSPNGFIFSR